MRVHPLTPKQERALLASVSDERRKMFTERRRYTLLGLMGGAAVGLMAGFFAGPFVVSVGVMSACGGIAWLLEHR